MRRIVESKRQRRLEIAALPFPKKVRIVEQMREAVTQIKRSRGGDANTWGDQGTLVRRP